jgi:hypothetical protein
MAARFHTIRQPNPAAAPHAAGVTGAPGAAAIRGTAVTHAWMNAAAPADALVMRSVP